MHAILVVDMAGMTLALADKNAAAGVAKVLQLRRDVRAAVDAVLALGCVFKYSRDNAFYFFDKPETGALCRSAAARPQRLGLLGHRLG